MASKYGLVEQDVIFSHMDHYVLCLSYHSSIERPYLQVFSQSFNTTDRLFGPKRM